MAERRRYSDDEVALARDYLARGLNPTGTEARALATASPIETYYPIEDVAGYSTGGMGGASGSDVSGTSGPGNAPPPQVQGTGGTFGMTPDPGMSSGGTDLPPAVPGAAASTWAPPEPAPSQLPPPAPPAAPVRQGTTVIVPQPATPRPVRPPGVSAPKGNAIDRFMAAEAKKEQRPIAPGGVIESMTPEERAEKEFAEGQMFESVGDQSDWDEFAREEERNRLMEVADEQEQIEADFAQRQLAQQQEVRGMESRYRELADEVARTPIDSNRIWNSKSTGEKVLAKIQLAVSTFGFGLAGQENPLIDQIENEIERDLDAQKANKALQQSRLAAEGTLIGMARDRFQTEAAIRASMKEAQLRKVAQQLEVFRDYIKEPSRRAAADQMLVELNDKIAESERERRLATEAEAVQRRQIAARGAARPNPVKARIGQLEDMVKLKDLEGKLEGKTPESSKAKAEYDAAVRAAEDYRGKAKNYSVTDRKKANAATQAWNSVVTDYQNKFLGKSDTDRKAAETTFPEPGVTTTDTQIDAAADAMIQKARQKFQQEVESTGGKLPERPQGTRVE